MNQPSMMGGGKILTDEKPSRLHADRAAGRDRDHRGPDRPAAAGGAVGPRGGPAHPVHQQPQADRPGDAQLRIVHTATSRRPLRPHADLRRPAFPAGQPAGPGPALPRAIHSLRRVQLPVEPQRHLQQRARRPRTTRRAPRSSRPSSARPTRRPRSSAGSSATTTTSGRPAPRPASSRARPRRGRRSRTRPHGRLQHDARLLAAADRSPARTTPTTCRSRTRSRSPASSTARATPRCGARSRAGWPWRTRDRSADQ